MAGSSFGCGVTWLRHMSLRRNFVVWRPAVTEPTQAPALVENMLLLRREDFEDLLDRAAERGAERVLALTCRAIFGPVES